MINLCCWCGKELSPSGYCCNCLDYNAQSSGAKKEDVALCPTCKAQGERNELIAIKGEHYCPSCDGSFPFANVATVANSGGRIIPL